MAIERLDPKHFQGKYIVDHYARYCLAAQFVTGKRVLDVACGYGYGSHFLKNAGAAEVVGVDLSEEAIQYARMNYAGDGMTYLVGDAHRVDELVAGHFDLVVSFETVEHLKTPPQFIRACRAVSRDDATLLFSVPNEAHAPPDNEFHQQFFDEDQFRALLEDTFAEVVIKPYAMTLATTIGEPDYRHCEPLYLGDGAVGRAGPSCQRPDGYIAVCRPRPGQIHDYNLLFQSRSAYEDTQHDLLWLEDERAAWMQIADHNIVEVAKLKREFGAIDSGQAGQLDARHVSQSYQGFANNRSDCMPTVSDRPSVATEKDGNGSQTTRNLQRLDSKEGSWRQTAEKLAMQMVAWRRLAEQRDRILQEQERVNRWLESENRRIESAFQSRKAAENQGDSSHQTLEAMKQALAESRQTIKAMEATMIWRYGRAVRAWFPIESRRGRLLQGLLRVMR
jgi:SAM-dependent methyltransferase